MACGLPQAHRHILVGQEKTVLHSTTYMNGLLRGSQLNWDVITKEAYDTDMSIKKLLFYLDYADFTLRSDDLPL